MTAIAVNTVQIATHDRIMKGTLSPTSFGYKPLTGFKLFGLAKEVEMKLKKNAPPPKPEITIPPASPIFFGK